MGAGEIVAGVSNYADGLYFETGEEIRMDRELAEVTRKELLYINYDEVPEVVEEFLHEEEQSNEETHTQPQPLVAVTSSFVSKTARLAFVEVNEPPSQNIEVVPIYREVLKTFSFTISNMKKESKEKLLRENEILNSEIIDEVLKIFAKDIIVTEPTIERDKICILASQLAVKFNNLIERDSDGCILMDGCTKLGYKLEFKVEHQRRINPIPLNVTTKQLPKKKEAIDCSFKKEKQLYDLFMADYNDIIDKESVQNFIKKTFTYQRVCICFAQKIDKFDAFDVILKEWPFLKVEMF